MFAMRFGDTNVDKDGKINAAVFDGLCEDVASLLCRFGLAAGQRVRHRVALHSLPQGQVRRA